MAISSEPYILESKFYFILYCLDYNASIHVQHAHVVHLLNCCTCLDPPNCCLGLHSYTFYIYCIFSMYMLVEENVHLFFCVKFVCDFLFMFIRMGTNDIFTLSHFSNIVWGMSALLKEDTSNRKPNRPSTLKGSCYVMNYIRWRDSHPKWKWTRRTNVNRFKNSDGIELYLTSLSPLLRNIISLCIINPVMCLRMLAFWLKYTL